MKKIYLPLSIVIILVWGVFLRFSGLDSPSFWIDEGYSSIVSYYATLHHFVPIVPSGEYALSQYFFVLLQSVSFTLFGYSDFTARFPSLLFGIATMALVYVFSRDLLKGHRYSNFGAVFILFLFTFSAWQIIWSREARFYEMLGFIYLLGIYLLSRYAESPERRSFIPFVIVSLVGAVFHPFCLALLPVGGAVLLFRCMKDYRASKNMRQALRENKQAIITLACSVILYVLAQGAIKYITSGSVDITNALPSVYEVSEEFRNGYVKYYLENLFSELGIVFVFFLIGVLYLAYLGEFAKLIIFGGLFLLNFYGISQKGYLAHSRYMFHLYGMITVLGGYIIFLAGSHILERFSVSRRLREGVFVILFMVGTGFFLINTYHWSFFPQKTYYIDYTSPKPDFKAAYKYLEADRGAKIVSGFPHLCYWYNRFDGAKCVYGLRIDLVGQGDVEKVPKGGRDFYTGTPHLDDLRDIRLNEYYFVLDALSIKNALNKDIMTFVIDSCDLVYKHEGNSRPENFVGVWKCH